MTTPSNVPTSCEPNATPPRPPSVLLPKIPAARPPHVPQIPCKGQTPTTSSIFSRFCVSVNSQTNSTPAIVPPAIASSEFIATSPEILSIVCALITLKPNQPTESTQAPSARNGIDDGGCAAMPPSFA